MTGATSAQRDGDGTEAAAPDSGQLEIFISHKMEGREKVLAGKLFQLLGAALYGSDQNSIRRHIFFSSDADAGLDGGGRLDDIQEKVRKAKRVVAVVTPRSLRSTGVQAEMHPALEQGKLIPVVARSAYKKHLTWPFGTIHARCLDSDEEVTRLVAELSHHLDRPVCRDEQAAARQKELVAFAHRRFHAMPVAPFVAAAVVLLLIASYYLGALFERPKTYVIYDEPQEIGGQTVRLVTSSDFPTRFLRDRLHELSGKLQGDHARAKTVFLKALEEANVRWGLEPEQLIELQAAVGKWRSGRASSSSAGCSGLEGLDLEWCTHVTKIFGADQTRRKAFDDTCFALIRVEPSSTKGAVVEPSVVLMGSGLSVGALQLTVKDFRGVVLREQK